MRAAAALALVLCGCASPTWDKPGSTEELFRIDSGQCRAQAYSAPIGAPKGLIFDSCMEGKGWSLRYS